MIDNIKFNLEFESDEVWLEKIKTKYSFKENWCNDKGQSYVGKLFKKGVQNSSNKSDSYLSIKILKLLNQPFKIYVENSLRKWYFGNEVVGDFTKIQFLDCINLISEKLEIPKNVLQGAKVTKVEYGANLHFKPKYKCFYHCIHEHLEYKKKCVFGSETLEFKGEYRSVIFYDKITEQKGKTFKARNQKKLNAVKLLLRYEIKIKKMSGCTEKDFMSNIKDILIKWDKMVNSWKIELNKIAFVNDMSPEIYDYLKDTKIKPIKDYLIYLGVKSIGTKNFGLILEDRIYVKNRKKLSDEILNKLSQFDLLMNQENFEEKFKMKVNSKAKQLML